MEKMIFLLSCFLWVATCQAQNPQVNRYQSVNYHGDGVTAYLHLVSPVHSANWEGLQVLYYTSKKEEKVSLRVHGIKEEPSYPNSAGVAYIEVSLETLQCQDEAGKIQTFNYMH